MLFFVMKNKTLGLFNKEEHHKNINNGNNAGKNLPCSRLKLFDCERQEEMQKNDRLSTLHMIFI